MRQKKFRDRSWLEKIRLSKGLTQTEVAKAAGCSVAHYNRVEKGLTTPGVDVGIQLSETLGFDIHEFLNERIID